MQKLGQFKGVDVYHTNNSKDVTNEEYFTLVYNNYYNCNYYNCDGIKCSKCVIKEECNHSTNLALKTLINHFKDTHPEILI